MVHARQFLLWPQAGGTFSLFILITVLLSGFGGPLIAQTTDPASKDKPTHLLHRTDCNLTDSTSVNFEICFGEPSPLTGTVYEYEGVYTEQATLTNQFGCDSVVTAEVMVYPEETLLAWAYVPYGYEYNGMILTETTGFTEYDTLENGCVYTIHIMFYVYPSSVEEWEEKLNIQVFPNPARDLFFIAFEAQKQEVLNVEILDILGRKMATLANQQSFSRGQHRLEVNAGAWPPGTYLVRFEGYTVSDEKTQFYKKVVVR